MMEQKKLFNLDFVSADCALDIRTYGRFLSFLRRHPTHACRILWGIFIPPHEGFMLKQAWENYRENVYVCSRATSKSFVIGSLFPATKSLLFRDNKFLIASASMFRGGKMILKDVARLMRGSLSKQKIGNNWGINSVSHRPKAIKQEPDMWSAEFKSTSLLFTIPTNKEESVRGIRATTIVFDERNNFDGQIIQTVYRPFLGVGTDFENPALAAEGNQTFNIGTIDYTYRDFHKEVMANHDLAKLQYEVQMAIKYQNWAVYDRLMADYSKVIRGISVSLVRYDYTDLLIPTEIGNYKVNYPGATLGKQIVWDDRDSCYYIYTYPVTKRVIEEPLDQGKVEREYWEAEYRNQFIKADGNVYPADLVDSVMGPIYTVSEENKKGWDFEKEGIRYFPPILYESEDPCVLSVDVARSQDFTSFIITRMGDLPLEFFVNKRKDYDLRTHSGPSNFSNIIWAEQHQQLTAKDVANKIRELRSRYNLVATRVCPAIAMDSGGGGTAVRDELVNPSPEIDYSTGLPVKDWVLPQRIYDPEDKDDRIGENLLGDPNCWYGLRLLKVSDILNHELVSFTKAQMQTHKLYIGNPRSVHNVTVSDKLYPAVTALAMLKHQLLRIQAVVSPTGKSIQYVMPGADKTKIENKKDLFSAFIYGGYALRQWVNQQIKPEHRNAPIAYGEVFTIGRR